MPFAYSVFFTAIGFTMSAWFRKTLIALAVTFGLFIAFQASVGQWIRPHYMTPVTVTAPLGPDSVGAKIPTGAWVVSDHIVDKNNIVFDRFSTAAMPMQCQKLTMDTQVPNDSHVAKVKAGGGDPVIDCLNQAGYHEVAKYQPAYRYWDFQRTEAGIYLSLAAVAVAATYLLVLKRDA
jgi:hypothetical protein